MLHQINDKNSYDICKKKICTHNNQNSPPDQVNPHSVYKQHAGVYNTQMQLYPRNNKILQALIQPILAIKYKKN